MFLLAFTAHGSNTSKKASFPTRAAIFSSIVAITAIMPHALLFVPRKPYLSARTALLTLIRRVVLAVNPACRHAPTMHSTLTPIAIPLQSVTTAHIALKLVFEPACVVVCPVHAIIAGDLHHPDSEIARIVAREPVRTRKPEQGTGPNVYYLGAEEAAINPEIAVEELPQMTMWSTLLKSSSTWRERDRQKQVAAYSEDHQPA